jgi:hypothetical protein
MRREATNSSSCFRTRIPRWLRHSQRSSLLARPLGPCIRPSSNYSQRRGRLRPSRALGGRLRPTREPAPAKEHFQLKVPWFVRDRSAAGFRDRLVGQREGRPGATGGSLAGDRLRRRNLGLAQPVREPKTGPTFGPTFSASTCNAMGHVETLKLLRLLESGRIQRSRYRFPKLNVEGSNPLSRST